MNQGARFDQSELENTDAFLGEVLEDYEGVFECLYAGLNVNPPLSLAMIVQNCPFDLSARTSSFLTPNLLELSSNRALRMFWETGAGREAHARS